MKITHTARIALRENGRPITCGEVVKQVEGAAIPSDAKITVIMGTTGQHHYEKTEPTHLEYTWETSL